MNKILNYISEQFVFFNLKKISHGYLNLIDTKGKEYFFGDNKNLELQYRGRIRELKNLKPITKGDSDLRVAMKLVSTLGKGPAEQIPNMGCNIKWFK